MIGQADPYQTGYAQGYQDALDAIAAQKGMRLSRRPTDTQRDAVKATLPRSGTKGLALWRAFVERGASGMTDDEVEQVFGWTHQSASAARNGLMNRGLLKDSGLRRKNRRGLQVIVWIPSHPSKETNDRQPDTDDRPACPECGTTTCSRRRGYPYCYGPKREHIHVWTWRDSGSVMECKECGADNLGNDGEQR